MLRGLTCRFQITSAAPISKSTLEFFLSLGIPIYEIYGMSECTGPATVSLPHKYKTGSAGFCMPGAGRAERFEKVDLSDLSNHTS